MSTGNSSAGVVLQDWSHELFMGFGMQFGGSWRDGSALVCSLVARGGMVRLSKPRVVEALDVMCSI